LVCLSLRRLRSWRGRGMRKRSEARRSRRAIFVQV
jgi:hypothetical protein